MGRYDYLREYGGIGGRVAGARHPVRVPLSNVSVNRTDDKKLRERRKQQEIARRIARERLRELSIETLERRRLKTLSG